MHVRLTLGPRRKIASGLIVVSKGIRKYHGKTLGVSAVLIKAVLCTLTGNAFQP